MNEHDQRIIISRTLGWKQEQDESSTTIWTIDPDGKRVFGDHEDYWPVHILPNYPRNLNDMHDAEMWLESNHPNRAARYPEWIKSVILNRASLSIFSPCGEFRSTTASASVRAESWLRAMIKWTCEDLTVSTWPGKMT